MNQILAIPFELRLAGLFVVGLCGGSFFVNLAVYRLAWYARSISPWSAPLAEAPPRYLRDRMPVLGWLGLRREAALHGSGFWIRPMLVELLSGVGLAWLYWWEVGRMALLPVPVPADLAPQVMPDLHAQFACHAVLVALMLIASLIDVDERIIPDAITVPGTLLGLLAASVYPRVLLPDWVFVQAGKADVLFLHVASPNIWPPALDGFPRVWPLALGLGCWWLWCVALMPRTWYSRHGWTRAVELCLARLKREPTTWWLVGLGLLGSCGISAVWFFGVYSWMGLLSALVGMAASGGLVWLVRFIGTAVLRREAMGFGDVTLMAMIGTILGWQTCLMVFFLAPFAGLVIGLAGLVLRRGPEIPYGPFLCLAAVGAIVRWQDLWQWAADVFQLGWIVPAALVVCLILMAGLLGIWRAVLAAIR